MEKKKQLGTNKARDNNQNFANFSAEMLFEN